MSQLSRERERKRGAKRRAKSKITSVFLIAFNGSNISLIFQVFLIVIVATSEIRCSLAGSLRWLSALEFTSLWLGVLGRHYLSSALLQPQGSTQCANAKKITSYSPNERHFSAPGASRASSASGALLPGSAGRRRRCRRRGKCPRRGRAGRHPGDTRGLPPRLAAPQ